MTLPDLPVSDVIPQLLDALNSGGVAVLQAPPGAGKTTLVPLAMLANGTTAGKILILEPRRLAARSAAERMAQTLGENVGQQVGYRIKGERKVSSATRIEVITEGILTRMIQSDPALDGIGTVIFDEFHERSLNSDLGLALVWESRAALRLDLQVLVMSATLDAAPVADLLGAPVITSHGRAFDVTTHWLDRPPPKNARFETEITNLIIHALSQTTGGVLVFLPGEREIRRVETTLRPHLPDGCRVHPLYGAMDFKAQRAAIEPTSFGRKLVLATAIAQTSLTIPDIRVVVDGGLARRARFDPGSGMSRLITEPASKAEATQRQGRAGRVAKGDCFRLWTRGADGGRAPFPPSEIETGDLSAMVLELALWGARSPQDLAFLTQPSAAAFTSAQALLHQLGALDDTGGITDHGRALAHIPLHPRLAHLLSLGGRDEAPLLAALLADRDPLRGVSVDLHLRQRALENQGSPANNTARPALNRIRAESRRLQKFTSSGQIQSWASLSALAYPDRVGIRRPGDLPKWVLSGGKGVHMAPVDPLANARLIVVCDTDGHPTDARIRQAIEISEAELRAIFADQMGWRNTCHWSKRERRVIARRQERFGALVLTNQPWENAPAAQLAQSALEGIRDLGLPLDAPARRFCARVELVRLNGGDMPNMAVPALLDDMENWLLAHVEHVRNDIDIKRLKLLEPLRQMLSWDQIQMLERLAPSHFITPMGGRIAIDYDGETPQIALRLQEMFGVSNHPHVAGTPLRITLLSPARRPLQTTTDLPGFWASSYSDVRKDMRGRYPKHPWPEDPTNATPTLRAKPRKN